MKLLLAILYLALCRAEQVDETEERRLRGYRHGGGGGYYGPYPQHYYNYPPPFYPMYPPPWWWSPSPTPSPSPTTPTCSYPKYYKECGSACPSTCAEPFPEACTQECVAGCFCPPGLVLNEEADTCVPLPACPAPPTTPECTDPGTAYDPFRRACIPISCDAPDACAEGLTCKDASIYCIRSPCPQFTCERESICTDPGTVYDPFTRQCVVVSCEAPNACGEGLTCKDAQVWCIRFPCPQFTCEAGEDPVPPQECSGGKILGDNCSPIPACDATCASPDPGPCPAVCGPSRCLCPPGTVLDEASDTCVEPSACPDAPTQPEPWCPFNLVWSQCTGHCGKTCRDPELENGCPYSCTRGCICPEGLVLDEFRGYCVPVDQCPPSSHYPWWH